MFRCESGPIEAIRHTLGRATIELSSDDGPMSGDGRLRMMTGVGNTSVPLPQVDQIGTPKSQSDRIRASGTAWSIRHARGKGVIANR